jgi:DNA-binding NarL/FixJ family response regulator
MPQMDGIALLRALADQRHKAARIVITSFADKHRTLEALNLGADYLLEKPFLVEQLDGVIQKILANGQGEDAASDLLQRQLAGLPISARERQLITYVLKGLPNAEIAKLLSTTEASIKSALFVLYRKLGIASRGELFHLMFPI